MNGDIAELESSLGRKLPGVVDWFLSQHEPGAPLRRTFTVGLRQYELRGSFSVLDGPGSIVEAYRDLLPWTKGDILPLLNDMSGQYIGVRINPPMIGQVVRTDNYLGHADDKVTLRVLRDDFRQWWNELSDEQGRTEDVLVRIAHSGRTEHCHQLKISRNLNQTDQLGRTLLDLACDFGNLEVVNWCLKNGVQGKHALSQAFFSGNWRIAELLISLGWGLDGSSTDNLHGIPVRNRQWLLSSEERETFTRLLRLAENNYHQSNPHV